MHYTYTYALTQIWTLDVDMFEAMWHNNYVDVCLAIGLHVDVLVEESMHACVHYMYTQSRRGVYRLALHIDTRN